MTCKFDRNDFRIIELGVLRGFPGNTPMTTISNAKNKEDAIKKYYENFPGSSKNILVVPEECVTIHTTKIQKIEQSH